VFIITNIYISQCTAASLKIQVTSNKTVAKETFKIHQTSRCHRHNMSV